MAVLFPCIAVSLSLGVLALMGNNLLVDCNANNHVTVVVQNTSQNIGNSTISQQDLASFLKCSTSYQLYGYVELFGGAGVGFVCLVVVTSALRPLRLHSIARDAKRAELDKTTIGLSRLLT